MDLAADPRRVQLRRTHGWRKPPGTIVVARPGRWGNPFVVDPGGPVTTRAQAVALFAGAIEQGLDGYPGIMEIRQVLRGHDLACWCPLTDVHGRTVPCHADVLLRIANR